MTERFSCSRASADAAEPLSGTASRVRRWVLLEQPGPWGADAAMSSRLPGAVAAGLRARAQAVGARVLLIRRPGRSAPERRVLLVATTTPAARSVEAFELDDPADVLDLDLTPLVHGGRLGGREVTTPVYLVCTNGRHDPCCAELGRPLAQAMADELGDSVWESSHFGGDRFAGNLVCLPDGLYFGRVPAEHGTQIARRYAAGEIDLAHFRGRSSFPVWVQAAEHAVREERGLVRVDDVALLASRKVADRAIVAFTLAGGGSVEVRLTADDSEPRQLTCTAIESVPFRRWEVYSIADATAA